MLEIQFELNINGIMEEVANCQDVNTAVIQETLHMYPINKHALNLQIQWFPPIHGFTFCGFISPWSTMV